MSEANTLSTVPQLRPPSPKKNISLPYSSINLNYFKIRRYVKPKAKQEMFAIEHIAIVERKREREEQL